MFNDSKLAQTEVSQLAYQEPQFYNYSQEPKFYYPSLCLTKVSWLAYQGVKFNDSKLAQTKVSQLAYPEP